MYHHRKPAYDEDKVITDVKTTHREQQREIQPRYRYPQKGLGRGLLSLHLKGDVSPDPRPVSEGDTLVPTRDFLPEVQTGGLKEDLKEIVSFYDSGTSGHVSAPPEPNRDRQALENLANNVFFIRD